MESTSSLILNTPSSDEQTLSLQDPRIHNTRQLSMFLHCLFLLWSHLSRLLVLPHFFSSCPSSARATLSFNPILLLFVSQSVLHPSHEPQRVQSILFVCCFCFHPLSFLPSSRNHVHSPAAPISPWPFKLWQFPHFLPPSSLSLSFFFFFFCALCPFASSPCLSPAHFLPLLSLHYVLIRFAHH